MEIYPQLEKHLQKIEAMMIQKLESEDPRIYGMLPAFMKRGGKRIRPALCLLSCGVCGGDYESVLEPSAIIELFHNFTLIHDDIEDDSRFRRGEPTIHVSYGIPIALNSGDALYTLLLGWILDQKLSKSKIVPLERLYLDSFKRVVDGQGLELDWIRQGRFDVNQKEYLQMVAGKTSALMGLSCETGAYLAGKGKRDRAALRMYGEKIGMAFQIHDDILNVTGDFAKYQKEIGGDISEGKRTLMVVHCLENGTETGKKRLKSILSSHTTSKEEINEAIAILRDCGSIEYARSHAARLVMDAKTALSRFQDSEDRRSLMALAEYCIHREK